VVVTGAVRQFELIVQDFRVVDTEPTLFGSDANHFINQVELIFCQIWLSVLIHNELRPRFILVVVKVNNTLLSSWLLNKLALLDSSLSLHDSVDILRKYAVRSSKVRVRS